MRTSNNKSKWWAGMLSILLFSAISIQNVYANRINIMMEISWYAYGITYNGLMVTYTDNTGCFIVDYHLYNVGYVRVIQDVYINNKYDNWGNCTTFLYCSNPMPDPPVPYAPDNFVIYPNGAMYTQDANGIWSTAITARVVPVNQWRTTLRRYGIN